MYVCICKGITERQIERSILSGEVNNWRDVRNTLGVATECGKCACHARAVLQQTHEKVGQWTPNAA
ncbi:(2Fe-2S)-binding protein [Salinispirillum sp. LH 10-3-1]|uniref:Bacterioferritin-associated ferredoxin n=1 Tax=Salinispirillum sp. LH 10-3-1 TaxID=2952525 RepID=A0AB38YG47_9GAMM